MPQFSGQQPQLPPQPLPQGGNPSGQERAALEQMFSQAGSGMNPGMSQMDIEQLIMLIQRGGPEALAAQQVLDQIMQQMQMEQQMQMQQQGMPPQQQMMPPQQQMMPPQQGMPPQGMMPPQQGMPAPGGYQ